MKRVMKKKLAIVLFSIVVVAILSLGSDCDPVTEPETPYASWRNIKPPINLDILGVDGFHKAGVWFVGISENNEGAVLYFDGVSVKTKMPPTGTGELYAVDAYDSDNIWVGGEDSNLYRYDGVSWTKWGIPAANIQGIDLVLNNFGFAVGNDGMILQFDGVEWVVAQSPTDKNLRAIEFVSADEAWAVGFSGTLLHYENNVWTEVNTGVSVDLYDLDFVSATEGWLCGDDGMVMRYKDGVFTPYDTPISTVDMRGIGMVNENRGWAGGKDNFVILYESDSWGTVGNLPSGNWEIEAVEVISETQAWIVGTVGQGGFILYYTIL